MASPLTQTLSLAGEETVHRRPVAAPPDMMPDGGVNALSGLRELHIACPVSTASPGMMPAYGNCTS
ncbi:MULTISPECIES: hypothetical protein [Citrobacter]|uniref:hypothetical protein n=1 Tax=Citrobacter TaxID=544 RepID=UPI0015E84FF3|nr:MULTISPECIES: hypothetical protein [Citrobacter]MBL4566003.1 hypothetical protein [Citrobacter koseri]MCK7563323.1 hypothetical protein [Citrobacter koseri]MDM2998387.1 hypothetical protein [Citrobacter sp. CK192]MDM3020837.1 hypothetical protein [Citrobacter sp. CK193]MDM3034384.1 hypothetical protein [Citrobacter sp. CK186]